MKPWTLINSNRGRANRRNHPDYGLRSSRYDTGKPCWQIQFTIIDRHNVRRRVSWHIPRVPVAVARQFRDWIKADLTHGTIHTDDDWRDILITYRDLLIRRGHCIEVHGRLSLPSPVLSLVS